jgi:hypothetical protein
MNSNDALTSVKRMANRGDMSSCRMPGRHWASAIGAVVLTGVCASSSLGATGSLYICAAHVDPDDWQDEWSRGPVTIPAGLVFDYAGHIFNGLQDVMDMRHRISEPDHNWDVAKVEEERRNRLLRQDIAARQKNTSGVVTTHEVTLTKEKPCAETSAAVVLASKWNWTVAPLFGDSSLYYQAYGVVRQGRLETAFDDDESPMDHLAVRGQINASIRGALTRVIRLAGERD